MKYEKNEFSVSHLISTFLTVDTNLYQHELPGEVVYVPRRLHIKYHWVRHQALGWHMLYYCCKFQLLEGKSVTCNLNHIFDDTCISLTSSECPSLFFSIG